MAKKILIFIVCVCLLLTAVAVYQAPAETLEEYKERMKREQEETERKKKEEEEKKKKEAGQEKKTGDGGGCFDIGSCLSGFCQAGAESGCFESFFQLLFEAFIQARYANYPFAPDAGFDFSAFPRPDMSEEARAALGGKFWMVEAGAWGSYLFGQNESVFDFGGILNVELAAFHLNVYYQRLMSVAGTTLDTFSANAGFSLPILNVILSFYAGAVWQEITPWYFSFGTSGKIFIHGGIVIGWYSLFAFYSPFFLIIVTPDVELALGRFTLGLGFNYYNYNNYVNFGPALKAAVWL